MSCALKSWIHEVSIVTGPVSAVFAPCPELSSLYNLVFFFRVAALNLVLCTRLGAGDLENHVYKFGCHASMNEGFFSRLANAAKPRGGSSSAYLPPFCSTRFLPSFCSAFVSSAVAATNFN